MITISDNTNKESTTPTVDSSLTPSYTKPLQQPLIIPNVADIVPSLTPQVENISYAGAPIAATPLSEEQKQQIPEQAKPNLGWQTSYESLSNKDRNIVSESLVRHNFVGTTIDYLMQPDFVPKDDFIGSRDMPEVFQGLNDDQAEELNTSESPEELIYRRDRMIDQQVGEEYINNHPYAIAAVLGSAAADPTNYLSFGLGAIAKTRGIVQVGSAVLGTAAQETALQLNESQRTGLETATNMATSGLIVGALNYKQFNNPHVNNITKIFDDGKADDIVNFETPAISSATRQPTPIDLTVPKNGYTLKHNPEDTVPLGMTRSNIASLGGRSHGAIIPMLSESSTARDITLELVHAPLRTKGDVVARPVEDMISNDKARHIIHTESELNAAYKSFTSDPNSPKLTIQQFKEAVFDAWSSREVNVMADDIPETILKPAPELGYAIKNENANLDNINAIRTELSNIESDINLSRYTKDYVIDPLNEDTIKGFLSSENKSLLAYGPPGTGKTSLFTEWMRQNPNSSVEILDANTFTKANATKIIEESELGTADKILYVIDEVDKFKPAQVETLKKLQVNSRNRFLYTTNKDPANINPFFRTSATAKLDNALTNDQKYAYAISIANKFNVDKSVDEIKAISSNPDMKSFRDIKRAVSEGFTNKFEPFMTDFEADISQGFTEKLSKGLNDFQSNKLGKNVIIFNGDSFKSDANLTGKLDKLLNITDMDYWKKNAASLYKSGNQIRRVIINDKTDAEFISRIKGIIEQSNDTRLPLNLIIEDPKNLLKDEAIFSRAHVVSDESFFVEGAQAVIKSADNIRPVSTVAKAIENPHIARAVKAYQNSTDIIRNNVKSISHGARIKHDIGGDMLSPEFFNTRYVKKNQRLFVSETTDKLNNAWKNSSLDIQKQVIDSVNKNIVNPIKTIDEASAYFAEQIKDYVRYNKGSFSYIGGVKIPLSISDLKPYMIKDISELHKRMLNKTVPNIHLINKFGSASSDAIINPINREYDELIKNKPHLTDKLEKERDDVLKSIKSIIGSIKGEDRIIKSTTDKVINTLMKTAVAPLLSGSLASNLTDVAKVTHVNGMKSLVGYYEKIFDWSEIGKASQKELEDMIGITSDMLASQNKSIAAITDRYADDGFNGTLDNINNFVYKWSGMTTFSKANHYTAGRASANKILDLSKKVFDGGKLSTGELSDMKFIGLSENTLNKIYHNFKSHGEGKLFNIQNWDNNTAQLFQEAIGRSTNGAIGKETAASLSAGFKTPIGRLLFQFQSFGIHTWNYLVLSGVQKPQAKYISTLAMIGAMGYIQARLKYARKGEDFPTDPKEVSNLVVSESGIVQFPSAIYDKTVGALTGISKEELLGVKSKMYKGRSVGERITAGLPSMAAPEAVGTLLAPISEEVDFGNDQLRAVATLLPFNDNLLTRDAYYKLEKAFANKMDIKNYKSKQTPLADLIGNIND